MKVRITHAPVEAGRNPKSFSESASERLQRTVVGVQGDVRDRHSGMRQLILLLFPTIAVVAWLPEFLRLRFGTTCGTACGFDTLGAPDLAFSPECPGSSRQLQRGGLQCPDHPLYSCVRFLILNES